MDDFELEYDGGFADMDIHMDGSSQTHQREDEIEIEVYMDHTDTSDIHHVEFEVVDDVMHSFAFGNNLYLVMTMLGIVTIIIMLVLLYRNNTESKKTARRREHFEIAVNSNDLHTILSLVKSEYSDLHSIASIDISLLITIVHTLNECYKSNEQIHDNLQQQFVHSYENDEGATNSPHQPSTSNTRRNKSVHQKMSKAKQQEVAIAMARQHGVYHSSNDDMNSNIPTQDSPTKDESVDKYAVYKQQCGVLRALSDTLYSTLESIQYNFLNFESSMVDYTVDHYTSMVHDVLTMFEILEPIRLDMEKKEIKNLDIQVNEIAMDVHHWMSQCETIISTDWYFKKKDFDNNNNNEDDEEEEEEDMWQGESPDAPCNRHRLATYRDHIDECTSELLDKNIKLEVYDHNQNNHYKVLIAAAHDVLKSCYTLQDYYRELYRRQIHTDGMNTLQHLLHTNSTTQAITDGDGDGDHIHGNNNGSPPHVTLRQENSGSANTVSGDSSSQFETWTEQQDVSFDDDPMHPSVHSPLHMNHNNHLVTTNIHTQSMNTNINLSNQLQTQVALQHVTVQREWEDKKEALKSERLQYRLNLRKEYERDYDNKQRAFDSDKRHRAEIAEHRTLNKRERQRWYNETKKNIENSYKLRVTKRIEQDTVMSIVIAALVLIVYFAVSFKCKVKEGSLYTFIGDRVSQLCLLIDQEQGNDGSAAPPIASTASENHNNNHNQNATNVMTNMLSYSTSIFYSNILTSSSLLVTSLFDRLGWDKSWMDLSYVTCYSHLILRTIIPTIILKAFSLLGLRREGVLVFLSLIIISFYHILRTFFASFVTLSLLLIMHGLLYLALYFVDTRLIWSLPFSALSITRQSGGVSQTGRGGGRDNSKVLSKIHTAVNIRPWLLYIAYPMMLMFIAIILGCSSTTSRGVKLGYRTTMSSMFECIIDSYQQCTGSS